MGSGARVVGKVAAKIAEQPAVQATGRAVFNAVNATIEAQEKDKVLQHDAKDDAPAQAARLGRDISKARECIKGLKDVPDFVRALWEGYDAALEAAQAKLDAALAAKRAANHQTAV